MYERVESISIGRVTVVYFAAILSMVAIPVGGKVYAAMPTGIHEGAIGSPGESSEIYARTESPVESGSADNDPKSAGLTDALPRLSRELSSSPALVVASKKDPKKTGVATDRILDFEQTGKGTNPDANHGKTPATQSSAVSEKESPRAAGKCKAPNCPTAQVSYIPNLPPLGDYSEPDACLPVHPNNHPFTVILKDNESLDSALTRLAKMLQSAGAQSGGVIEVPWDTKTVQCDTFKVKKGHIRKGLLGPLTLRGVPDPVSGKRPRFYCRATKLGGTIDKGFGTVFYWGVGSATMMENIHVDGYGKHAQSDKIGYHAYRNNYFHHATNDGHGVNGWDREDPPQGMVDIQYCGNEVSHSGQGNTKHCFYMHRGRNGHHYKITLVDNVIHSCNWSEGFKSTAEENVIVGNRFYKTVPPESGQPSSPELRIDTDQGYEKKYGNTLLNLVTCGNHIIKNNSFHVWRPEPQGHGSSHMIMFSNRRGIQGCDIPEGYVGDNKSAKPNLSSPFWSKEYWDNPDVFTALIENNRFELSGPNAKGNAIEAFGTYPNVALRQFGPSCLLDAPEWWSERFHVIGRNNTFVGFQLNTDSAKYSSPLPGHAKRCKWPKPATSSRMSQVKFEVSGDTDVP